MHQALCLPIWIFVGETGKGPKRPKCFHKHGKVLQLMNFHLDWFLCCNISISPINSIYILLNVPYFPQNIPCSKTRSPLNNINNNAVQFCTWELLKLLSWVANWSRISKFQANMDYCQALNHEPLARVILQALPVFEVNFIFTFLWTDNTRVHI